MRHETGARDHGTSVYFSPVPPSANFLSGMEGRPLSRPLVPGGYES